MITIYMLENGSNDGAALGGVMTEVIRTSAHAQGASVIAIHRGANRS